MIRHSTLMIAVVCLLLVGTSFADQLDLEGVGKVSNSNFATANDQSVSVANFNRTDDVEQSNQGSVNTMTVNFEDELFTGSGIDLAESLANNENSEFNNVGVVSVTVRPTQEVSNNITNTNSMVSDGNLISTGGGDTTITETSMDGN